MPGFSSADIGVAQTHDSVNNTSSEMFSLTQSKSKTIITRSMLTISLIVFTDKLQGHVHTFYSKWYFITF